MRNLAQRKIFKAIKIFSFGQIKPVKNYMMNYWRVLLSRQTFLTDLNLVSSEQYEDSDDYFVFLMCGNHISSHKT